MWVNVVNHQWVHAQKMKCIPDRALELTGEKRPCLVLGELMVSPSLQGPLLRLEDCCRAVPFHGVYDYMRTDRCVATDVFIEH